tara:strand:- start:288 stop:1151 length:864 start_codon:yes stop_codon:yes gene_type:complete
MTTIKDKVLFARHDTFHLRDGWITKGLQLAEENHLSKPDAHHDIGVGINMLKSIRHWLEATNLIHQNSEKVIEFSDLGKYIFENDKYFEDNASLWMIHYQLCTNIKFAPVWYYVFNINQESAEFELGKTEHYVLDHFSKLSKSKVSINSIIKDLRCLIRTYIADKSNDDYDLSCPLSELNLIHKLSGENLYTLNYGKKDSLPLEIFLICLIDFAGSNSDIEIGRLRFNFNSPGRIFCLSFDAIRDYIAEACHKYPEFFSQVRTYESEEFRILKDIKTIRNHIYQNIY